MRDMYDELFGSSGDRDAELEPDLDAWEEDVVDSDADPFEDFEEEE